MTMFPNFDEAFVNLNKSNSYIKENTMFLAVHGSHAYSLNTESSDIDLRGVCFGPLQQYLGINSNFEQHISNTPFDITVFELKKFLGLCANANPNALEILFVPERCIIHENSMGKLLRENKEIFLSKKLRHTLSGYAVAQLKRIKLHRAHLLNPPKEPGTREEFGLPSYREIRKDQFDAALAIIREDMDGWDFDWQTIDQADRIGLKNEIENHLVKFHVSVNDMDFVNTAYKLGYQENFVEVLQMEKSYRSKVQNWNQYQHWLKNRNPKRAEIEKKWLFDAKHASHLVRLTIVCEEVLKTGKLNVDRNGIDADLLRAIKNEGIWTYEYLIEWAEQKEKEIKVLYDSCTILPKEPDYNKINDLCEKMILEYLNKP